MADTFSESAIDRAAGAIQDGTESGPISARLLAEQVAEIFLSELRCADMREDAMSDLLNCPFCGGDARYGCIDDKSDINFGGHFIDCASCGACTTLLFPQKGPVERELAERWNRRARASQVDGWVQYETFGYALAMQVLQSDLYHKLDDKARGECDEMIQRGMSPPPPPGQKKAAAQDTLLSATGAKDSPMATEPASAALAARGKGA